MPSTRAADAQVAPDDLLEEDPPGGWLVQDLGEEQIQQHLTSGQMFVMVHVSRWLAGQGLDAGGLTPEAAGRFLVVRAADYTALLSSKALVPLLGYLRRLDAAP